MLSRLVLGSAILGMYNYYYLSYIATSVSDRRNFRIFHHHSAILRPDFQLAGIINYGSKTIKKTVVQVVARSLLFFIF